MRRAIIDNPKDSLGAPIRLLLHDLVDESAEGFDTRGGFAAAKDFSALHIPGGQVSQRATPFIFKFHAHGFVGAGRQRGMQAKPGLDTGFLVGRNHVVARPQGLAVPLALIEIEHAFGLALEIGIAWKDPTAMLPGANGICIEPPPNGSSANLGYEAALDDLADQILATVAREWLATFFGQLAGDGFDLHDHFRGKNGADARNEKGFPSLPVVLQKSVCAIC